MRIAALFTCIIGVFMLATSVQAAQPADITRLSNGLTVLVLKDDRFPLASLRLYVHAGSAFETPEEAGISHLLEHMVFKGTVKRPKGQVARDVESVGGYLNAATSFDYTVYLTDMPSTQWKLGMDVLRDMAFEPALDPAELESEKDVVIAELQRGEDSPDSRIFQSLQAGTLKGTTYERPIIGYRETIRATTADTMRAYIRKHYQPQSMLLTVVGNVDPAEVRAEAERLFGGLTNDQNITPPAAIDARAFAHGPVVNVEHGPWKKVYLGVALPVPGLKALQAAQLDMLSQLLGGDPTALLYRTFKYEKQLVDDISVANYSFERVGMLYITAELDADKVETFWKELTTMLAGLKADAFTEQEFERARLNIEDGLYRSKETVAGLASKEGYFQFFSDGPQGEANYLQAVRDVERPQLEALIRDWLRPERLTVSVLLPEGTKAPALAATLKSTWPSKGKAGEEGNAAAVGKTETVDLGGGRKVVLIPDTTLPYTALDMVFSGGNALLDQNRQGLAALTASVLTKGTLKHDAPTLEAFQSDRAASLGASAGRRTFTLSLREPSRFDGDMFGLLHEVLTTPALAPDEVAREKRNQVASIRAREDQPLGLAFRHLTPFLFPGHSYGFYHLGQPETVEGFTRDDVKAFWARQAAQPWVMSVAGSFDREAVLRFAKSLPAPSGKPVSLDAPAWTPEKALDLRLPERNQAHLLLVFPTVGLAHKDTPALELLQSVLAGQSGLLFRDMRDKQGLGYTVTAMNWQSDLAGFMVLYIGTEPGKLEQAEAGFRKVIDQLHATALPDEELRRGKNQLRGDYYREHQRLGSRSSEAAMLTSQGYPLLFNREVIDKAEKLAPSDLERVARTYLDMNKVRVVKVLP